MVGNCFLNWETAIQKHQNRLSKYGFSINPFCFRFLFRSYAPYFWGRYGHIKNPSYKQVSAGGSGHTEAVQVIFDDQKVSYSDLVEYFWKTIDPTDGGGQFCDRGQQYRSEIFYLSEEQHSIAKASKKALANSGLLKSEIATQLTPSSRFYLAEDLAKHHPLLLVNKIAP